MYNNITDYVLGPMHGQPYPITSQRPLPNRPTDLQDGCRPDDSDDADDDPAFSQAQPVTEAGSSNMDSADDIGPFILSRVDPDSVTTLASRPAVLFQPPESQPSMASASSHFTLDDHVHTPGYRARPKSSSELKGRPNVLKGGASPQALGLEDSSDSDDDDGHDDDSHDSGSDDVDDDGDGHAPMLRRRLLNRTSGEVKGKSRQSGDQCSSFGFSLPRPWTKGKRQRSDDSAQEDHPKSPGSEGPAGNSPEAEGKAEGLVKACAAVSFNQHKLRLNFMDARVERRYCAWQAQQRTKVPFCSTTTCMEGICHAYLPFAEVCMQVATVLSVISVSILGLSCCHASCYYVDPAECVLTQQAVLQQDQVGKATKAGYAWKGFVAGSA